MLGVIVFLVEMTIGEGGKEGEGRKNWEWHWGRRGKMEGIKGRRQYERGDRENVGRGGGRGGRVIK